MFKIKARFHLVASFLQFFCWENLIKGPQSLLCLARFRWKEVGNVINAQEKWPSVCGGNCNDTEIKVHIYCDDLKFLKKNDLELLVISQIDMEIIEPFIPKVFLFHCTSDLTIRTCNIVALIRPWLYHNAFTTLSWKGWLPATLRTTEAKRYGKWT